MSFLCYTVNRTNHNISVLGGRIWPMDKKMQCFGQIRTARNITFFVHRPDTAAEPGQPAHALDRIENEAGQLGTILNLLYLKSK